MRLIVVSLLLGLVSSGALAADRVIVVMRRDQLGPSARRPPETARGQTLGCAVVLSMATVLTLSPAGRGAAPLRRRGEGPRRNSDEEIA